MAVGFLQLPGELRSRVYELVLLHPKPINVEIRYRLPLRHQHLDVALIRVNKSINREAVPVFYGGNTFNVSPPYENGNGIFMFVVQIGPSNASHIQHIMYYDFLYDIHSCGLGVALGDRAAKVLAIVKSYCPNVRTFQLDYDPFEDWSDPLPGEKLYDHHLFKALNVADTHIRLNFALQESIVDLYVDDAYDTLRNHLVKLGWRMNFID